MADPATIIGLTSSIITFIDFGVKVVHLARSIQGPQGAAPHVHELDILAADIQALCDGVLHKRSTALSDHDERMVSLAAECRNVARDLRALLEPMRAKNGGWARAFYQTLRRRGDVDDLWQQLSRLDVRLRESVGMSLQMEHNSAVSAELRALSLLQGELGINYNDRLDEVQQDIRRLIQQTELAQNGSAAVAPSYLGELRQCLDSFEGERVLRRNQCAVIKSLYFPEIRRRWDQIPRADDHTNTWLFDPITDTGFRTWLGAGEGVYWITGKAGSGKSTLMKFASEHPETKKALEEWAGPATPYFPSFFFWNQGFEMQKSLVGLLQSIVYHILRSAPTIIPIVCPERFSHGHERWEFSELKETIRRILSQPQGSFPAKFCFFIDGLDEYNGDEEDLLKLLSIFENATYHHVKLCVSSRPRQVLDNHYRDRRFIIDIRKFTKPDMKTHVRQRLEMNAKFQQLQVAPESKLACNELIKQLADRAEGVWLWVNLITHDLVHAVNRDEGIAKLQEILESFPRDLNAYFRHIIDGVRDVYREEMAKLFLITVEELQPLPLYAFSLLDRENSNPSYAISAPIDPIIPQELEAVDQNWRSRLENRCRDLLVVDDGDHPTFLLHPVDFLHRTVREFLRDNYSDNLRREIPANSDFQPLISLCRMMLYLLKGLPIVELRNKVSITRLIKIVDELLYYAHEVEKRDESRECPHALVSVLDEMDKVNSQHARGMRNHWTHVRDSPRTRGYDEYREGGHCNFMALMVQSRLVKYVRTRLESEPKRIKKAGRPLLDYALRPRRVTPISMPYHSRRQDDTSVDPEMVSLLLQHGADPNQRVHLNDGRTVWALFLLSCYEMAQRDEASAPLQAVWYRVCELLVTHGADLDAWVENEGDYRISPMTIPMILDLLFGKDGAERLKALATGKNSQSRWSLGWWLSWRR